MKTFLHRPQSVFLRRALFQVHLWVGVFAGLYVFLVCVTGSALVFRIELQRAMHPDLFTPPTAGPQAHPADVLEAVRDAFPEGRVSGIDAPTTARPTYLAYVMLDDRFLTLLLDPVSAGLLGELPPRSFVRWLQDLHVDLLMGRAGRVTNGVGAILLLVLCATGLVIWWPGLGQWRRALTVDFGRSWKRVTWDLHSAVGFWTLALTVMWAVTGLYYVWPSPFRAAVNAVSPLTVSRAPNSNPSGATAVGPPPTWRALLDEAQAHRPGQFVARVVVPSADQAAFHVLFSDVRPTPVRAALTSVYLDRFTGALLQEEPRGPRTAGDAVMAWIGPLHFGSFGGVGVKVAWLVLGLAPPLLFVTGFLMWWTRVVRVRWLRVRTAAVAADAPNAAR